MSRFKLLFALCLISVLGVGYYWQEPAAKQASERAPAKTEIISSAATPRNPVRRTSDRFIKLPAEAPNFEDLLSSSGDSESEDAGTSEDGRTVTNIIAGPGQRGGAEVIITDRRNAAAAGSSSPELEALREAAELFGQRSGQSLIPGVRVSSPQLETDTQPATAQVTATPRRQEIQEVTGQARGYTMLYLMHPRARQTVEKQIEAMLRSRVQQLYIGVLIDGTFGRDFNYLTNVVRRINRERRSLVLVVYLTNGSTMRSFENPVVEAPFNTTDPVLFRILIRTDPATRQLYESLIRPVVPVLQLNRRLNPSNRNFVSVMLEDNLDDPSYVAMRQLAQGIIGNRATFIRNPCGGDGCPEGSTRGGLGDPVESHMLDELEGLAIGDAFSLDGTGYRLPGETDERIPAYEEVRQAAVTAASRGLRYFGLWRFERQGNKLGENLLPVNDRTFEVPSDSDIQNEIELLRAGLTPVE